MAEKQNRHKRPYKVTPWVSAEEKASVDAAAKNAGLATHEWCRRAFAYALANMPDFLESEPAQQKATQPKGYVA